MPTIFTPFAIHSTLTPVNQAISDPKHLDRLSGVNVQYFSGFVPSHQMGREPDELGARLSEVYFKMMLEISIQR